MRDTHVLTHERKGHCFHRQTHKHTQVKIIANRLSDYVSVTPNTAWVLYTRHITTHTHTHTKTDTQTQTLAFFFFPTWPVFIWVCVLMGNVTATQTNRAAQNRQLGLRVYKRERGRERARERMDEYQYVFLFPTRTHICTQHTQTAARHGERSSFNPSHKRQSIGC